MRSAADGGRQVGDHQQVPHFLHRDLHDRVAPGLHRFRLIWAQPILIAGLQAEGGVEIAAHQRVLDLRGLGEQMEQLFA